jgi:hypothetical protein
MILRDFIKQMRRIFRFKRGPTCQPRFLAEEPAVIKPGLIYIVGEEKCRWAAVFKCPCGCGDAVWLNLLQGHSPQWEVEQHTGGKISLSPSVNRIVGCRSHFFLWRNRIHWCLSRYPQTLHPPASRE